MNETQARENAYLLMLALDTLENHINKLVDTGELAAAKLKRGRKPKPKGA